MSPTISARKSTFELMIEELKDAFGRKDNRVNIDEVWKVLESYKSEPKHWSKFAYYDLHKYKRNLVFDHEKFNVMVLTWGPNTKSSIHDHSGSHCFMKNLDGELIESRFAWPDTKKNPDENDPNTQVMNPLSVARMELNDVIYINDKVGLHHVENPSSQTAASLHVYIPPYRKCRAFDRRTGQAQICKLTFYSKCGEVIENHDDNENQDVPAKAIEY